MSNRITNANLDSLANMINEITGNPKEYSTKDETKRNGYNINIGHYHIGGAYGGVRLEQTMNEGGGIRVISTVGYSTKKDLYNWMTAYYAGLQSKVA